MSNSNHEYQERLGAFTAGEQSTPDATFSEPPIPPNQESLKLLNPIETLEVLRDPTSDIRQWLHYIDQQYAPPDHTDVLLLYPCAAEKPMPDSKTYTALANTLSQYSERKQRRVHVVTVSEPMGLIPFEFQDGNSFLYDNPGLFEWWVKNNDRSWNKESQQQCLRILGEHIAGFLDRALENEWYDTHISCIRHLTPTGNTSGDQTHRQMLEIAEAITDIELTWLPTEDTVLSLVDEVGTMAWQMQGVAHSAIQAELATRLDKSLLDESHEAGNL